MSRMTRQQQLDAAAEAVYQELQRAGASDGSVRRLRAEIAGLPVIWTHINRETVPQRRKRRGALASKMRNLAAQVSRDREWCAARLDGHDAVTFSNVVGRPLLSDWLRELAETVEQRHDFLPRLDRKTELRSFVLTQIRAILDDGFPQNRKHNHHAEVLASAALNEKIPSGTLAQIRKRS